ncbi:PREDICTED: uncharacterized protein LOC104809833 [Tarenaya hassleriana]|uniref:uncharacterized protein LOC104809833 n=1 Tax=Tarenaya hassleriana TaxID=28532 RepID=UPI00053C98F7|nr:PREDICTED: uncharacterized protein LOC104809833 [Tarenaya hassleriana]XP_010534218.1 PREDICTED: uncharacterized protein LOC104809833 [Tarenaya hassleriana]XP_010534219.1 PREDICTED: uncharacterized protein LOC104809833 [Tarenaya hassleriana]
MESPPPPPPERSNRLHNFTLPHLRWGQQRFLRCAKPPHHQLLHRSPPPFPSSSSSPSPDRALQISAASASISGVATSASAPRFGSAVGNGKPGLDLRYNAKSKVSILAVGTGDDGVAAARPWNLRTRRAACYEPRDEAARIGGSPARHESGVKRGSDGDGDGYCREKNEKLKFSVPLLREEIEEDFAAMIGKRPPRRPKKRHRIVQKQLNSLFPGLWLTEEVTADSYNVVEILET